MLKHKSLISFLEMIEITDQNMNEAMNLIFNKYPELLKEEFVFIKLKRKASKYYFDRILLVEDKAEIVKFAKSPTSHTVPGIFLYESLQGKIFGYRNQKVMVKKDLRLNELIHWESENPPTPHELNCIEVQEMFSQLQSLVSLTR